MSGASNLFQFAQLLVRSVNAALGTKPLEDFLKKSGLDKLFTVHAGGMLESNFAFDDPALEEHYKKLLTGLAELLQKIFGRDYTQKLFKTHYQKLSSWAETPEDLTSLSRILPPL